MSLSSKEKRQLLYAALLHHAPDVGSLRDRVLDRLVLVALLGSSSESPMTLSAIRDSIRIAPDTNGLRPAVLQTTLSRLRDREAVAYHQHRNKPEYSLTELGRRHTDDATATAVKLFEPVLASMIRNTGHLCTANDATGVCRTFICECFARSGQQIAREVAGHSTKDQLLNSADFEGAFRAATKSRGLADEARQLLKGRCRRFLRSTDRRDTELKFSLTQGYYMAQLFGVSEFSFNPLARDAFRNAVFYLDTNVLVTILLSHGVGRSSAEVTRVLRGLDIQLRVTRATIEETNSLANGRYGRIKRIPRKVPSAVVERIDDEFLEAFLVARKHDTDITLDDFFTRFGEITRILEELEVTLDERTADEIIGDRDVAVECEVVRTASRDSRGEPKTDTVCRHDVAHFLVVNEERAARRNVWFLTRDKTLSRAATELESGDRPFCFSLTALVHSVSPFVETEDTHSSLVELFASILRGEISGIGGDSVFTLEEVRTVSAMHADVLATEPDQLFEAFEFVKSTILKGQRLSSRDQGEISFEIRKYLAASRDVRLKELESRAHEEARRADDEQERRGLAEQQARKAEQLVEERDRTIGRLEEDIEGARKREAARRQRERRLEIVVGALGAVCVVFLWSVDAAILEKIADLTEWENGWIPWGRGIIRFVGAVGLVACVLSPVRRLNRVYQAGILGGIVSVAVGGSDLVEPTAIANAANYLSIGGPIALVLLSLVGARRVDSQGGA